MQYSQEHLKTMVYEKFGGQTECIMGNWKIENSIGSKAARDNVNQIAHVPKSGGSLGNNKHGG